MIDELIILNPFSVPKRADLRWNRQFEDLEELMCLQDELLDSASMWDSFSCKSVKENLYG